MPRPSRLWSRRERQIIDMLYRLVRATANRRRTASGTGAHIQNSGPGWVAVSAISRLPDLAAVSQWCDLNNQPVEVQTEVEAESGGTVGACSRQNPNAF
jgi:hypothetical protein